ncbi:MAG: hypothetical protein R3C11_02550 [Planctomycetaceae bacterium]
MSVVTQGLVEIILFAIIAFLPNHGSLFVDEELVQVEQTISHGQIVTGTDARFRVEFY